MRDKAGNIWVSPYNPGRVKYDGKSFMTFTTAQGLADNIVWELMQDKTANIWFGTGQGGAVKYDGKKFTNYTPRKAWQTTWFFL